MSRVMFENDGYVSSLRKGLRMMVEVDGPSFGKRARLI